MSSRTSIAQASLFHIFEETNSWDENGSFEICLSDSINQKARCKYNGDFLLTRKELFSIYQQLKEYFENPDWAGNMVERK